MMKYNNKNNDFTCLLEARSGSGMTSARGESGRSMVEMLGTLAIIGVLSVAGIAGYTYGMNWYRTNEILDGGNKRAYTVATQLSMGLQPNLSEFKDYNTTVGVTFGDTDSIKQWDGEFGISISGVTKPVCENLIRMIGDKTPLRALSKGDGENETELTAGNCADGENSFYLVYNIGGVGTIDETGTTTCDDGKSWNGIVCLPVDELPIDYVYFSEVSGSCPDGQHQASSSDILRDCNCEAGEVLNCASRCHNVSGCLSDGAYMSAGALVPIEIYGNSCIGNTGYMVCRY